ncbi:MAG: protein arginine kinase [Puniceicoccaceae bacterium]
MSEVNEIVSALIETDKCELTRAPTESVPVVLMTRIRLARNISGFPFPNMATPAQKEEIFQLVEKVLREIDEMKGANSFRMSELNDLDRNLLVERHLVSRELCEGRPGSGAVINRSQTGSVMVNEEDHLRIQVLLSGLHMKKVFRMANRIDDALERALDFAFSTDLGYLTSCPTNLGTAMRASVMLHLPGLVLNQLMDKVVRGVNQIGIVVRGLFGEGSDATGSIFQISNQQTLGESEETIIRRLNHVIRAVIEQETNARYRLLEEQPSKLCDKIGRALGVLKNGHLLSSGESMAFLSLMRLAVDLGFADAQWRAMIDRLMIEAQPGHVQYRADRQLSSENRDASRADFLRREFANFPELNFGHLNGKGAGNQTRD